MKTIHSARGKAWKGCHLSHPTGIKTYIVANVGDSIAVLGCTNPYFHHEQPNTNEPNVIARVLTKEHKPDVYTERVIGWK